MSSTSPEPLGDRVPQLRPPAAARTAVLKAIKVVYTIVWALFAGCILAIPIASLYGDNQRSVLACRHRIGRSCRAGFEQMALPADRTGCPVHHRPGRKFRHLPSEWLARHNKVIFGTIYLVGVSTAGVHWVLAARWRLGITQAAASSNTSTVGVVLRVPVTPVFQPSEAVCKRFSEQVARSERSWSTSLCGGSQPVRLVGRNPKQVQGVDRSCFRGHLESGSNHQRGFRFDRRASAGRSEIRREGLARAVAPDHEQRDRGMQASERETDLLRQRLHVRQGHRTDDRGHPVQSMQQERGNPRADSNDSAQRSQGRQTQRDDCALRRFLRPQCKDQCRQPPGLRQGLRRGRSFVAGQRFGAALVYLYAGCREEPGTAGGYRIGLESDLACANRTESTRRKGIHQMVAKEFAVEPKYRF